MLRVSARRKVRMSASLGEKLPTSATCFTASSMLNNVVFVVVVVGIVVVAVVGKVTAAAAIFLSLRAEDRGRKRVNQW